LANPTVCCGEGAKYVSTVVVVIVEKAWRQAQT